MAKPWRRGSEPPITASLMEIGSAQQPLSQPAADSSPYTGEPFLCRPPVDARYIGPARNQVCGTGD